MDLLRRIRWNNVARAVAALAAIGLVIAWPSLRSEPPEIPVAGAAEPPRPEIGVAGAGEAPRSEISAPAVEESPVAKATQGEEPSRGARRSKVSARRDSLRRPASPRRRKVSSRATREAKARRAAGRRTRARVRRVETRRVASAPPAPASSSVANRVTAPQSAVHRPAPAPGEFGFEG